MTYTDPDNLTPSTRATGARRRLRALAWMGHSPEHIAGAYGLDLARVTRLLWGGSPTLSADEWYTIAIAFDDLEMRFGSSEWARETARAEGWKPPLAWDEDTLDDPFANGDRSGPRGPYTADHAVAYRRMHGEHDLPMHARDQDLAVRLLHRDGLSDYEIADRLGMWVKQVKRCRDRQALAANRPIGEAHHAGGDDTRMRYSRAKYRKPGRTPTAA